MNFNKIQTHFLLLIICLSLLTYGTEAQAIGDSGPQNLSFNGDSPFTKFEVDRRSDLLDLEVSIKQKSSLVLRILDETGKEIFHSATEVTKPRFRTRVDIASFPSGKYKIVIYTNDGRYIRNFQK